MKVFITGCARSGTTLLQRLFWAYDGFEHMTGETKIDDFAANWPGAHMCGKRYRKTIFSDELPAHEIQRQRALIRSEGLTIVDINRKRHDVLNGGPMRVTEERWAACRRQRIEHSDLIQCVISYEHLCAFPDENQRYMDRTLGIEHLHRHDWSSYPDFVPEHVFEGSIYPARPIDTKSIS
jgi:hypothetical protein